MTQRVGQPFRIGDADPTALLANLRARIEANGGLIPDDQAPSPRDTRREARDRQWQTLMKRKMWPAHPDALDDQAKRDVVGEWLSDPTRNLLLLGRLGRGKTFTACAAARVLHDQGRRVVFHPIGTLMKSLGDNYGHGDTYREAAAADVLILDDVGAADLAGSRKADWLYDLINDRYLDERPTIVTSNTRTRAEIAADPDDDDPDEQSLEDAVTDRVYARLTEHCTAAFIGGHDRRAARRDR